MATTFNEDNTIEQMIISTPEKQRLEVYPCRGAPSYAFGCAGRAYGERSPD